MFEVGDRVTVTETGDELEGLIGTVAKIPDFPGVLVLLDEDVENGTVLHFWDEELGPYQDGESV